MSREIGNIKLTSIHDLAFDKDQFILKTCTGRNGDVIGYDNDNNPIIKIKDSIDKAYLPTIAFVCKYILDSELKSALSDNEISDIKSLLELGERFDELFLLPQKERLADACKWFNRFVLTNDMEKKYNSKCKELVKLRSEFKQFKVDHGYEGEE